MKDMLPNNPSESLTEVPGQNFLRLSIISESFLTFGPTTTGLP